VPDTTALDELAGLVGPAGVLYPGDGLDAYEDPARGAPGRARAVVRPTTTEQVRTVVGWARRHRTRLLPQGANTGLVGASVPPPDGDGGVVVLSTERMVHGLEIDAANRTAVVPAGVRLSALDDAVAADGLWFPIDLAADPTIGGMAATNTGGARMLRHGDVRRRVLGIEAVLADEGVTVVDDLSVLRKDNTGIDLSSMFIGSSGALGIITRVAVELARRPAQTTCVFLAPTAPDRVMAVLDALDDGLGPLLSAFEVMSAESVAAALAGVDGLRSPFGAPAPPELTILVEAAGPEGTDALLLDAVAVAVATGAATDAVVAPAHDAWRLRHALTDGLRHGGVVLGFDVSVPRSALAAFRSEVRRRAAVELPRATVADFGHWGDGGMHCNLVFPTGAPPSPSEHGLARELVFGTAVERFGGSYSAEHGIGPHNADWWRRVTPPGNQRVVRSLRTLFDPLGVLGHPDLPY